MSDRVRSASVSSKTNGVSINREDLQKTTRSHTTTDKISDSCNETSYSVHPEAYKLVPVLAISDMLKILLVNNDDNHNGNHMDDVRKLQVDMKILNPLEYLINPHLTETPGQMDDTNFF